MVSSPGSRKRSADSVGHRPRPSSARNAIPYRFAPGLKVRCWCRDQPQATIVANHPDPRKDRQKPSPGRVINMNAGHTRVVDRRPTFRPRRQQDPDLIASGAALAVGEIRTAPNEPPCCLNSRDPDAGYKHGDEDRPEADIAFHVRRISALSQLVTGSDQSTASVQVERSVGSVVDPACVCARSRPRVPPDSGSFIEKVDQGRDDHFACVTGYP